MKTYDNILLSSKKYREQRDFWCKQLSDIELTRMIEPDFNTSTERELNKKLYFTVQSDITDRIIKIGKGSEMSIFIILLTAFEVFLYKYSGKNSLHVLSPVYKGSSKDLFFNDEIIIHNLVNGNQSYKELLKKTKEDVVVAFENQEYPLEKILSELGIEENVYDILFLSRNLHNKTVQDKKHNLIISYKHSETGIDFTLEYSDTIYTESTVKRIYNYYMTTLEECLKNPDQNIGLFSILNKEERDTLLNAFNNTDYKFENKRTIIDMFEEQAAIRPEDTAVVCSEKSLTYKQLNVQANKVAEMLIEKGIKKGDIVGLISGRSVDTIVGILGILKAGGAYLPIDPSYPVKRIEYILADSGAKAVLVQNTYSHELEYNGIIIDLNSEAFNNSSCDNPLISRGADDLVYVIYTSGSTGEPKGVMITSENVVNLVNGLELNIYRKYSGRLRVAIVAPFVFDASVQQIFISLLFGHSLYIVPDDVRADGKKLEGFYIENKIDISDGTPNHLAGLALNASSDIKNMKVKHFIIGGEALHYTTVEKFYSRFDGNTPEITNVYGPTECCVDSTFYTLNPSNLAGSKIIPIGKPMPNVQIYILGENQELIPRGCIGEVYISGTGVGVGYLNREQMTSERFIPNPFNTDKKMYKTGDLGRWLSDGNIEFIGRKDGQVKIRGYRIELGEIEAQLQKHENIREAVVIDRKEDSENKVLCAYFTANEKLGVTQLREHLSDKIPEYMIPTYFVQIEKIPLTINGKLDKNALPNPKSTLKKRTEYIEPRNNTEQSLVPIWQDVFQIEKVGIKDDFYELGGHSLKAITLSSRIFRDLNVEVPISVLLSVPNIEGIAKYIDSNSKALYKNLKPVEERDYYCLSSAQKRFFILNHFDEVNTSYNMPAAFIIEGNLDVSHMEKIFSELINRHDAFRTVFEFNGQVPVQRIMAGAEFKIEHIQPDDNLSKAIGSFIRPFDLAKAPLFRVGLIRLSDSKHVMVVDMHHIIADGLSINIIITEFSQLYEGKELPELKFQYKDFSEWQNRMFESGEVLKQEKYWIDKFVDEIPVLNLQTDFPRPSVQSYEGDKVEFDIDNNIKRRLELMAEGTKATLFMVLLTAYNVLLSKYSGQEDIIVGMPVSGRTHSDLEKIVGVFVNTLAIRTNTDSQSTFRELLEKVKESCLEAYDNQDYQFEELVDNLNLHRDTSRNPVFDTMFSFNNDIEEIELENLKLYPYDISNGQTKFDLSLNAFDDGLVIHFSLEYCTKLFKRETAEKITRHFTKILEQVVLNPEIRLSDIDMLTMEEKRHLLFDLNNTEHEYPFYSGIHQLFEGQAQKTPQNIALIFEGKQLTYSELNEKSNRIAWYLIEKGVKEDSVVGIMVERSMELIIGIMGILKAGGAYLPIDPDYPKDRIDFLINNSNTAILLTGEKIQQLHLENAYAIAVSEVLDNNNLPITNLDIEYNPERLLYVIYTSGSTGNPKGVMVKSHSFMNLLNWSIREFGICEKDCNLLIAPVSFDLAQLNIFSTLITGGRLCIFSPGLYNYENMSDLIRKEQVTIINCASSAFYPLIDFNEDSGFIRLQSLSRIFLGGDPINLGKLLPWIKTEECRAEIVNAYGPTECTDIATYYVIDNNTVEPEMVVPIGKPIDNFKIYILDKNQKLVPQGMVGELCIGGAGVARGYYNDPELTKDKFIECSDIPGTRVYRTGDLAKWNKEGNVEFIGRIDTQVKIRGYRIEMGEIEAAVLCHPAIREAVVIAKEDGIGGKYICAYIVSDAGLSITELKDYLQKSLPGYMIPSHFVQIEAMPLTPNGKINRKALPEPDRISLIETEQQKPQNELEEKLADIFKEILNTDIVGVNENFFDLGGNSLSAMILSLRINKEFNTEVSLTNIFTMCTIRQLANYIIQEENKAVYDVIEVQPEREHYPMSQAQRRMFILNQIEDTQTSYNIYGAVVIEGNLDVGKLESAAKELLQRHEILRTSFEVVDGEPCQLVHKDVEFGLELIKNNYDGADGLDDRITSFIRPFDLSKAPLIRVGLIPLEGKKCAVIMDMHHIISDGTSVNILMKDLFALYKGKELPPVKIQYKDFSVWQNKLLKSEIMKVQESYWLETFKGEIPVLNLPIDYPRPPIMDFKGEVYEFEIDEFTTSKIRNLASESNTTMFMILLSSYNVLLSKLTGQDDIIVGVPSAGRKHADIQNTVGMFINTIALRSNPEKSRTFVDFLQEVRKNSLKAFENQDFQFELLLDMLGITRNLSRNPLFDTVLNFYNMNDSDNNYMSEETDFNVFPYEVKNNVAKFDIVLYASETDDRLKFYCNYRTSLFKSSTIEYIMGEYVKLLSIIADEPEKIISDYYIFSRESIVNKSNTTVLKDNKLEKNGTIKVHKTLVESIEKQVEEHRESIAVKTQDRLVTYGELNDSANNIANIILEKSKRDDRVILLFEHGADMIIGILGVLKAGRIYVPLDPAYPEERLVDIFKDSEAEILITNNKNLKYAEKLVHILNRNVYLVNVDKADFISPANNPKIAIEPEQTAYILYTSGTTGKPKGVMQSHKNIMELVGNYAQELLINHTDRLGLTTSYCHTVAAIDIFSALLNGAGIYPYDLKAKGSIENMSNWIEENSISILHTVPSIYRYFIKSLDKTRRISDTRLIILGGEVVYSSDIEEYKVHFSDDCIFVNLFGASEILVAAFYLADKNTQVNTPTVPIGYELDGVSIQLLRDDNKAAGIYECGELVYYSHYLSQGYWNPDKNTNHQFERNPETGEVIAYKSGDLARLLPSGAIEHLGRKDTQVKIRGMRIELTEIESVVGGLNGIRECVAIVLEKPNRENTIVVFYVPENEEVIDNKQVKLMLKSKLPDYMIPSLLYPLESIPHTPNGKVDRKALSLINVDVKAEAAYEPPTNQVEERMAEIWSEILGVGKIGVNENFFELGGHSLKATSLVSRIHRAFRVEVKLGEVFSYPTIRELAKLITDSVKENYKPIKPVGKKENYPASSAQKRLFILNQIEDAKTTYNIPGAAIINGVLDKEKVERAFNKLVQRHEALRTAFSIVNGELVQIVKDKIDLKVTYFEVAKVPETKDSTDEIKEIFKKFVKPFDLSKAPLLRVALIKIAVDKHILLYDIHHIISDATSIGILVNEFIDIYCEKALPELKVQYKEFSTWQNELLKTDIIKKQEEFWLDYFKGELPLLNLPTDYTRPSTQSFEGDTVSFELDAELLQLLKETANKTGTTLFMLLFAAYNILLSKYSGQSDIIVGSPIAGRVQTELENVVGMFANTIAMRNDVDGNKTLGMFLKDVKENTIQVYENQLYQFDELINKLNLNRDLSRNPLFDTMFIMQNMNISERVVDGLSMMPYGTDNRTSKFDITVEVKEDDGKLIFIMEYCTRLFRKETIVRMARHLSNIIKALTLNLDTPITEVSLLSDTEKRQILYEFNNTKADYPKNKTIHELFEEQVTKNPDFIAAICNSEEITYMDLNTRANRIAEVLRDRGVQRDSLVAILVSRSVEMLAAILGVLKSGAAYLPLDPEYPEERIRFILEDSNAHILLANSNLDSGISFHGEVIDLAHGSINQKSGENLPNINNPKDLAYVLYTSGSTGKPKGVMISHDAVCNFMTGVTDKIRMEKGNSILALTTISFDIFVLETLLPLCYGLKVVIADEDHQKDPGLLRGLITDKNIDMLQMTPSTLQILMNELKNLSCFNSVKQVMIGGEAFPETLLRELRKVFKGKIYNMYGPTETTVWSAIKDLTEESCVSIGGPIANTQILIMNGDNLQPIGVAGEVCIGGDSLARGYLNRPELTKEKFVSSELVPGKRLYKTGDLAKWMPDGSIAFMGRIDNQVKIRGYRIELDEIEKCILKHNQINECVVIAKEDEFSNKQLICYYVSAEEITVSEIMQHIGRALPEYMIPGIYVRLALIPLTPNGKVDRRALPAAGTARPNIDSEYKEANSEIEKKIARIWKSILKCDRIGINDSFFQLGGNSILLVRMHEELEKYYPGKINVSKLFIHNTIAKLSEFISHDDKTAVNKLELESTRLPQDYFTGSMYEQYESRAFKYSFTSDLSNKITNFYSDSGQGIKEILLALYFYLLYQVTEEERIVVHTITDNENRILPLAVNLGEVDELDSLFALVSGLCEDTQNSFDTDRLKTVTPIKEKDTALMLFSSENSRGMADYRIYDIIINPEIDKNVISLTTEYNAARVQKHKIEELIGKYVNLINIVFERMI